jgi:hypothetical protein
VRIASAMERDVKIEDEAADIGGDVQEKILVF